MSSSAYNDALEIAARSSHHPFSLEELAEKHAAPKNVALIKSAVDSIRTRLEEHIDPKIDALKRDQVVLQTTLNELNEKLSLLIEVLLPK